VFGIGKWKTEAWEGIVVDKVEVETSAGEHDYTTYYLHIDLGGGEIKRESYSKKFYDQWAVGDPIVKRVGEKQPVKA
jgi:hypothetical protein